MDRKQEIIGVAYKEFAKNGYNTSLTSICKNLNIKKQSLYSHFRSKDDILLTMIEKEITQYFEFKKKEYNVIKELNCEEKLKHIYFSTIEYFMDVEKIRFWRWITLIQNEKLHKKCRDLIREKELEFIDLLKEIFHEGIESGEWDSKVKDGALKLFIAMMQGILDGILFYSNIVNMEQYSKDTWSVFIYGIKKRT